MRTIHPVAQWIGLTLALVACGRDSPAEPGDALAGAYDWELSVGGIAGLTRTPASEGYTVRIEFDGNGRVVARRNNAVVASASYTIRELPTAGPLPVYELRYTPPLQAFTFGVLDEHTVRTVANGVFHFVDPCCDRWTHRFRRLTTR